jgi:hypothetical protein
MFHAKTQGRKEVRSLLAPQAPFQRLTGASRQKGILSLRLCVFAGNIGTLRRIATGGRAERLGALGVSIFSKAQGIS